MSDNKPSTKQKQYPSDRHLNKADRHKDKHRKSHKTKDDGHPCICGYASCNELYKGFQRTNHVYKRPTIRLKVPDNELWGDFFDSLIRNLHVPEDRVANIIQKGVGFRFSVAAHHFTEEVVKQYWDNKHVRGAWKFRFGRSVARDILHLPLDLRDTDKNGLFFINANNPIVDAAKLLASIESGRAERVSQRSKSNDREKDAVRVSLEVKNHSLSAKDKELKQCYDLIQTLKNETRVLKQKAKRNREKARSASKDNKRLREELEDVYTMEDVTDIIRKVGGMTRLTLLDKKWHEKYPGAAKCMWGFNNFDEALVMVL